MLVFLTSRSDPGHQTSVPSPFQDGETETHTRMCHGHKADVAQTWNCQPLISRPALRFNCSFLSIKLNDLLQERFNGQDVIW